VRRLKRNCRREGERGGGASKGAGRVNARGGG
jgi:hypothetical protein